MNILAGRLPHKYLDFSYENLGIALITSALREAGHECRIWDGIQEQIESQEYVEGLSEAPERIVCIPVHAEHTVDYVLELTTQLKQLCPEKTVIIGGHPIATIDVNIFHTYPNGFDYLVRGEGEDTIVELVNYLKHGYPNRHSIAGLSYVEEGRLVRTQQSRNTGK